NTTTNTTNCLFVGTHREIEKKILSQTEFEHVPLSVEPVANITRHPLRFLMRNRNAYCSAKKILQRTSVKCVVGLGGMASLSVLYAAKKLSLPVLLMEQNIVLGRANRWFSKHAKGIALTFAETEGIKPATSKLTSVTGNPVRHDIAMLHQSSLMSNEPSPPTLLVLGGSQGATAINRVVMKTIKQIEPRQKANWHIVHQTGVHQEQEIIEFYQQQNISHTVAPFFSEMAPLYQSASLVISRAGATTLAELACTGSPAILIPYPNSVRDHQRKNARYFEQAGAARIVEQQDNPTQTAKQLSNVLSMLFSDKTELTSMQKAMHAIAIPDAAAWVVKMITEITTVL
ncbi:UDP-N-acetylglucosamine--N-acetylmuramyl-(pentapeptide) pyrophosphoryl-undecaprenol N-acetylglucosamine transferase, partial [hydrothermal vent metagenome]